MLFLFESSFGVKWRRKSLQALAVVASKVSHTSHLPFLIMPLYEEEEEFVLAEEDSVEGEDLPDRSLSNNKQHPERGLFDHTKDFLIEQLEIHGGPHACTRQNKLLDSICDKNKDKLGAPKSELRKRVQVCNSHWKSKPSLYLTAKKKSKERQSESSTGFPPATVTTATRSQEGLPSYPPLALPPPTTRIRSTFPQASPPSVITTASKANSSMFSPSKKKKDPSGRFDSIALLGACISFDLVLSLFACCLLPAGNTSGP